MRLTSVEFQSAEVRLELKSGISKRQKSQECDVVEESRRKVQRLLRR